MAADTQIELAREAEFALSGIVFRPATLEALAADGRREVFEPRIMQVLVALARRRGEVISRDELIRDCWAGRSVGEDSINRCIARLRRYAAAEGGFTLETIPRVGYRLVETPAPSESHSVSAAAPAGRSNPDRRAIATLGAVLMLLALGGLAYWLTAPRAVPPKSGFDRVAVLPFDTLSKGDDVHFFADALAEQMIGVLNDNQVQAVEHAKTAALRGAGRDEAARKLGVEFILDGSVLRSEAGLRVTVHLDHISTHTTLWSASRDQAGSDPLTLQAQVAALTVDEVKAALRVRNHGAIDDAALSAYLKAQEYARLGGKTATMQRRDLLREVVARAPGLSLGHSGLAVTTAQMLQFAEPPEIDALRAEARKEAGRALAIDPHNGEAYYAMILLLPASGLAEQEKLHRKGLQAEPDEPTLNSSYAFLLADEGRLKRALALARRAVMLDPLSPRKTAALAAYLAVTGHVNEARVTIERATRLWPANPGVWGSRLYVAAYFGQEQEARAMLDAPQRAPPDLEPDLFAAVRASMDAAKANTPAARASARRAVLVAIASGSLDRGAAIEALAQAGDIDGAFEIANREYAGAGNTKPEIETLFHPSTARMRADPRFRGLVERLGLPAFWSSIHEAPDFCETEDVEFCRDLQRS